jgi:hypothetical protein
MGIAQSLFAPWTRKHDKPGTPLIPQAPSILYPQKLEDLISICQNRPAGGRLHAAGSHWALSPAAISDHSFIETHDPNNVFPAMGRTLYEVVPGCLSASFLEGLNSPANQAFAADPGYLVHIESGKRIHQLYAELDLGDDHSPESLCALMISKFNNTSFKGPWGFSTLGGAGGQTVVGALSTGTHGGDFDRQPIADSVLAIHIVADGGKHYWIERGLRGRPFLTDPEKLSALYGDSKYGGPGNFEIICDESVLRAALVQVGRFGTFYSAVLRVTRQYGLLQELKQDTWEKVRCKIANRSSDLFTQPAPSTEQSPPAQRFLQIAINPIPSVNGTTHICGVTRRWTVPLSEVPTSPLPAVNWGFGNPAGRPEVVGDLTNGGKIDPLLNAQRFSAAGNSVGYSPDDSGINSFNFLDAACADASFMEGVVSAIYTEIENFLTSNAVEIGGALAGAVAAGLGPGLAALAPELLAILALLALFLDALGSSGPQRMGQAMNDLRGALLGSSDPAQRAAGIIVWRAIAAEVFKSMQKEQTYTAISYAMMDTHNYQDVSCQVNVKSIEVFFDAADPNLLVFVDRLLKFEIDQEFASGDTVVGYVSLRFCGQTDAWIGPEPFANTCAVECSGLADVDGSTQFVDYASKLALDPNLKGILHWGQQNDSLQSDIEFRFGDSPADPSGPLHEWRGVLSKLTENGRLSGFSSQFTRRTGLEVVQPAITAFSVSSPPSPATHTCTVTWDCASNPPETAVRLEVRSPHGSFPPVRGLGLSGSHSVAADGTGVYTIMLVASLTVNGSEREATQTLNVTFS